MDATWKHGFKFETTATGQLLSDALAVQLAFAVGRGAMVHTDVQSKSLAVRSARGASPRLLSALAFTKSLPILGSPLGVRMSVVGNTAEESGETVQQAEVSTSPLRVRNQGMDLMLDLLLDADADASEQLRVSVVRPQLLQDGLEISRVEVAAGALQCYFHDF